MKTITSIGQFEKKYFPNQYERAKMMKLTDEQLGAHIAHAMLDCICHQLKRQFKKNIKHEKI